MSEKSSPILLSEIPDQIAYAGLSINDLNLSNFIANVSDQDGELHFYATLADGQELPGGVICNASGIFEGKPDFDAISGEPYPILVVAKNDSDIPLVAYFNLIIMEADQAVLKSRGCSIEAVSLVAGDGDIISEVNTLSLDHVQGEDEAIAESGEENYSYLDQEFEDFLESLNADEVVKDPNLIERTFGNQFSSELNDPEYLAFVIRYFIRKFSSLQIYNASEVFNELNIVNIQDAKTGWKVYDSEVALTTTNPQPFSTDFCRSDFIATVQQMIAIASQRGWKTIGVKGCDRELGYRLVAEFNETVEPEQRLSVDNYTEFSSWMERAESQRFTKNYESRR